MRGVVLFLSLLVAFQPVLVSAQENTEGTGESPERPMPLTGPRRLLGREGIRALERRKAGAQASPDAAQQAQPTATPTPAPPTVVPPPPTRPGAGPGQVPGAAPGASAGAAGGAAGEKGGEIDFAARAKDGKFSFEFSKAQLMDVVKAISNLTRRNFIVPDTIKSQTITILSPTKITAAEAYQVFLSALETMGVTVVRIGKFYKLVESKASIKTPIPTCLSDADECPKSGEQMITMILRLGNIDGQQMLAILRQLAGKDGDIQHFVPSNALIVSDYAPNIQRLKRIIDALDVPGYQDELNIVLVQYATASEMAEKLGQIFEVRGTGAAATGSRRPRTEGQPAPQPTTPGTPPAGEVETDVQISKLVADDRTNMLIVKANQRSFDAVKRLLAKLDIPVSDAESGRVHVYYLKNAKAEELASTLSSLSTGQSARTRTSGSQPAGQAPNAPADTARRGAESAALFEGEVKITSDKATNSLLIMASGRDFRSISRLIEQLDVARPQVYVEAAILEVTIGDDKSFGTNWHAPMQFGKNDLPGGLGGPGTIGFVQRPNSKSGISPTMAPLTDPTSLVGIAQGSIVGLVGKSLTIPVGDNSLTLPSFGVILRALQSSSNAQILSTPHIIATDNEEAMIEVGQKIPFQRGTALPSIAGLGGAAGGSGAMQSAISQFAGAGSLFSSIDRIDVALTLKVTPQISERDKIRLEIDQKIEDIAGIDEATGQPRTANRSAKTTVVVDDQQTIVVGGLIRDRKATGETKIPFLGDLPIIGWLFKDKTTNIEKVNLLLVLTPYIIRDANDFQKIFERKMREHEEFAEEFYGERPDYRASIDYSKKTGPLGRITQTLREEKARAESGAGKMGESVVGPTEPAAEGAMAPEVEAQPVIAPAPPSGPTTILIDPAASPPPSAPASAPSVAEPAGEATVQPGESVVQPVEE